MSYPKERRTRHLVDPELLSVADRFQDVRLSADTLPDIRDLSAAMANFSDKLPATVERREAIATASMGERDVDCLLYRNTTQTKPAPAFLHIHGGGLITGSARHSDARNVSICKELGVTVISVEYRLAPENSYPAPLDDCHTALAWLHENASELGVDPARVAVGGESAGGGLAAGLCIRARDEGHFPITFQHLVFPMLDSETGVDPASVSPELGEYLWTAESNQFGWSSYLGESAPAAPAVPAKADDVSNLPRTWIGVGALDLFLDENIAFARRLMKAGVATELQIYPAAFHGFWIAEDAPVSIRLERDYLEALARGLGLAKERHNG